jgi:DNA-directed RNA polymerase specialized sigma24 family protein
VRWGKRDIHAIALPLPRGSVKTGMNGVADAALRRQRAQVFRYLRRRTGSDELADDLTQDVFLAAAAHLARLELGESPLAWLYTVAKSRLVDEARRASLRHGPFVCHTSHTV